MRYAVMFLLRYSNVHVGECGKVVQDMDMSTCDVDPTAARVLGGISSGELPISTRSCVTQSSRLQ
jgi:hypothetical protein